MLELSQALGKFVRALSGPVVYRIRRGRPPPNHGRVVAGGPGGRRLAYFRGSPDTSARQRYLSRPAHVGDYSCQFNSEQASFWQSVKLPRAIIGGAICAYEPGYCRRPEFGSEESGTRRFECRDNDRHLPCCRVGSSAA